MRDFVITVCPYEGWERSISPFKVVVDGHVYRPATKDEVMHIVSLYLDDLSGE